MSRRRSSNPTKPINITVPTVLLDKLHDKLSVNDSRSLWITGAIRMRLENASELSEVPLHQLRAIFHNKICGCHKTASCTKMIALGSLSLSSNHDEDL